MQPMGRLACTQSALIFFLLNVRGGGRRGGFFHFFFVPTCSLQVPNGFPNGVPNSTLLQSHMFCTKSCQSNWVIAKKKKKEKK